MELASVWPLKEGIKGVNRLTGDVITLNTFQKGFMDFEEAKELEKTGDLQLMAGLDMQSLKQAGDNATLKKSPPKKKATYKTKVVKAET